MDASPAPAKSQITQQDIKLAGLKAVKGVTPRVEIGKSFYRFEFSDSKITLFFLSIEVAHIVFSLDGNVAKVQTINTNNAHRRQNLGTLLTAVFYAYVEAKGVTAVQLGTQDTSGNFWSRLGISKSKETSLTDAWNTIGPIVEVPKKAVAQTQSIEDANSIKKNPGLM